MCSLFFFFFWNLLLVWKMLTELCRSRSNIISLKTWLILGDLAVSSVIFLIFCILFLNFHAFSRKSACDSCSINLCYKSCHNGGDEKVTKYLNVWKEKKHLITNQHGSFIRDENFLRGRTWASLGRGIHLHTTQPRSHALYLDSFFHLHSLEKRITVNT